MIRPMPPSDEGVAAEPPAGDAVGDNRPGADVVGDAVGEGVGVERLPGPSNAIRMSGRFSMLPRTPSVAPCAHAEREHRHPDAAAAPLELEDIDERAPVAG